MMKKILRFGLYSFLVWAAPLAVSMFFFAGGGEGTFMSKLGLVAGLALVNAMILGLYFQTIEEGFLFKGIAIGIAWFVVNGVLDYMVLVGMFHMTLDAWLAQVGLRYLIVLLFATGMSYIVESRKNIIVRRWA
ncbi:MAG: hypothetical protein V1843_02370 [bacterium]